MSRPTHARSILLTLLLAANPCISPARILIAPPRTVSLQPDLSTPANLPILQQPLHTGTPETYRAHIDQLRALVHTCRLNASTCNPAAVGDDDLVEPAQPAPASPTPKPTASDTFQTRWQWLRQTLNDARTPALPNRDTLLDQASARLDQELAAAAATQSAAPSNLPNARTLANSILAAPEFRVVSSQSWFDRKLAEFWAWFYRLFSATSSLGRRAPWLSTALEWLFGTLGVAAVLIWVQRSLARQSLAIQLGGAAPTSDWQKESAQWADLAHAAAERGHWRDAIHCLYWAAIVALERRRLWSRNYARTPREYLPLLPPGAPQQLALRSLTTLFERIWYGLRHASPEDYAQARALFDVLKSA